jgi:hypothetical protein
MELTLNSTGVKPLDQQDDTQDASAVSSTPLVNPGGYWHDPYKRADLTPGRADRRGMTGMQIADARRAENADANRNERNNMRFADDAARADLQSTLDAQRAARGGIGPAVDTSHLSRAEVADQLEKQQFFAKSATAPHSWDVGQPRSPHPASDAQVMAIRAARARVAEDPASQAGSGGVNDPYRVKTPEQRVQAIASQLKAANRSGSVSISEGTAAHGPAMVQNEAGQWVPMAQESQRIAAANERIAAPARMNDVGNRAYYDAIKTGAAKTDAAAMQIANDTMRGYASVNAPPSHDPYMRQRAAPRVPSPPPIVATPPPRMPASTPKITTAPPKPRAVVPPSAPVAAPRITAAPALPPTPAPQLPQTLGEYGQLFRDRGAVGVAGAVARQAGKDVADTASRVGDRISAAVDRANADAMSGNTPAADSREQPRIGGGSPAESIGNFLNKAGEKAGKFLFGNQGLGGPQASVAPAVRPSDPYASPRRRAFTA